MPDRGLFAPFSPNEEVTLRRVALGIAKPARLSARDVEGPYPSSKTTEAFCGSSPRDASAISRSQRAPPSISPKHRMSSIPSWPTSRQRRGWLRAGYP
jgi:hypothetical protein